LQAGLFGQRNGDALGRRQLACRARLIDQQRQQPGVQHRCQRKAGIVFAMERA
jgi:hypothetical protein